MATRYIPLLLALSVAPLADTCEPPPSEPAIWPEGGHFAQGLYVFTFAEAPYALKVSAQTFGVDDSGTLVGTYRWRFWDDKDRASSGLPEDCILIEDITGVPHREGSGPYDYGSCVGCDPYSELDGVWVEAQGPGCTDELIDFWYGNTELGVEGLVSSVVAYRHAETEGWPEEIEAIVPNLESLGYQGVLYDTLLEGAGFDPVFATIPTEGARIPGAALEAPTLGERLISAPPRPIR